MSAKRSGILGGLLAIAAAVPVRAQDGTNWMSFIPDQWTLGAFSIPGTHETCARFETVPDTAICQTLTLPEQLAAGVRFFDIRCRHINDVFTIHHGIDFQNLTFGEVLESVTEFLDANPSETVIMSVKEEWNASGVTRPFWQTFEAYHAADLSRWHVGETVPALGAVRGKIVLVRRFPTSGTVRGLDALTGWSSNVPATMNVGTSLRVQDWYRLPDLEPASFDAKWALVRSLVQEAVAEGIADTPTRVNFLSGHDRNFLGIPRGIIALADDMNQRLRLQFLAEPKCHGGALLVDFVTPALARQVYLSSIPGIAPDGTAGVAAVDSDHDGVPDEQEVTAGTDPFDHDSDGDGTSNAAEHFGGTDPSSAAWDLDPIVLETSTGAVVTWNAAPGRTYRVVCCGIDPLTRAFIGWHPVESGNACGFAVVNAPIGTDGQPLPERLRRWRIEIELRDCPADLDGSGAVDGVDLGLLLSQWGPEGCSAADLDDDGAVDGIDLGLMLASWGACAP